MSAESAHTSVLLEQSLAALSIKPDGVYVDGTFGRGGHSRAILAKLNDNGRVIGIDKDPAAIIAGKQLVKQDPRFAIHHASFASMMDVLSTWQGKIDGVLLDLGMSSPQINDAMRGFSFLRDGPLDMRMDTSCGQSAADWINKVRVEELIKVFKEFGEERFAKRIARAIVNARQEEAITRTKQLADIVAKAHPAWEKHKHPATRVFQAIRIFVNQELAELKIGLNAALELLNINGRLVVISFHSLEDRIVKQFMQWHERGGDWPRGLPVTEVEQRLKRIGRAVKPERTEIMQNPRARSAVMRVAEKIK